MDALILYCTTGGGHKSASKVLKSELKKRGHNVDMLDPYELVSRKLSLAIGNSYNRLVQNAPYNSTF